MSINKTPVYILFQSTELLERSFIEPTDVVEIGCPIDTNGDDMEYIGWTPDYSVADEWANEEIVSAE